MPDPITISKPLSIRDCGYDEYWLQGKIQSDPSALGRGDLVVVDTERCQSSGGRLDFLLRNPKDDSMYEVEVMLGDTDESHIIRTIEYWGREKKRWPQRQHFAVILAEEITRRFYDVIQLLSASVPIIAIKVKMVEVNGVRALDFTTVLDVYEEPEDENPELKMVNAEPGWESRSPATLEIAKVLLMVVEPVFGEIELNYTTNYISLCGKQNVFWLYPSREKSWVSFYVEESDLKAMSSVLQPIEEFEIKTTKWGTRIDVRLGAASIKNHVEAFREIAKFVRKYSESD